MIARTALRFDVAQSAVRSCAVPHLRRLSRASAMCCASIVRRDVLDVAPSTT